MKKIVSSYVSVIFLLTLITGVTFAAFTDKAAILGSTFSVGSSDIKLLIDVAGGVESVNLADELSGPTFDEITSNWTQDYSVKIYNNSPVSVLMTTNADYLTANDPLELRQLISVELVEWDDANNDGVVDLSEEGLSVGKKNIVKWKTEGFDLGQMEAGEVRGLVLRFSTELVSSSKQGAAGIFDFEFDSIGL